MKKIVQNHVLRADCGNRGQRGFTLVEISVVIGLVSLLSIMVFRFYFQSNRAQTSLIEGLQMQNTIVTGVNKVLREVRLGTEFIIPDLSEQSTVLVFSDFENNTVAIFPVLNKELTKEENENIYDLYRYKAVTKDFDLSSPVHVPANLALLCSDISDINFRLANAKSLTVTFSFKKGNKSYQTVTEGALMNSGDVK
ncbi:MAG: type II secretion system GspH family protein [Candidatus Riflebacteria bacterium]|nr:type II secretion system GspH family protein [Candidatus Riflebacteria bacterium]